MLLQLNISYLKTKYKNVAKKASWLIWEFFTLTKVNCRDKAENDRVHRGQNLNYKSAPFSSNTQENKRRNSCPRLQYIIFCLKKTQTIKVAIP